MGSNNFQDLLHSPAIARVMVNFASDQDVSESVILDGTGISATTLVSSDELIPRRNEMKLVENLITKLPDGEARGFELGTLYSTNAFGVWGFLLATSKNGKDAATQAVRYAQLSTAYCELKTVSSNDEFSVEFDPANIPPPLRQFLLERDMATGLNLIKQISLLAESSLRLEFKGPAPSYADRIQALAKVSICYNAESNRFVVPMDEALQLSPTYNESLVQQMENQCRTLITQRRNSDFSNQIRQALMENGGFVKSAEEIASELNMSTRSLRRKLDAENTNFRALVDETRQQLAEQLLATTNIKLDALAFQLGYSDPASFTRAFRRHHELSPGEYRKSQQ